MRYSHGLLAILLTAIPVMPAFATVDYQDFLRRLDGVDTAGEAMAILASGGFLYVAAGEAGLGIFRIDDPLAPSPMGTVDTPGRALGLAAAGDRVFVADDGRGLQVVDVSDPEHPSLVAGVDTSVAGSATGTAVLGDHVLVTDTSSGLLVFDVTTFVVPVLRAGLETPGIPAGVEVQGGLAYVADGPAGLQIVDVQDPESPQWLGTMGFARSVATVAIDGTRAFVGFENGPPAIVDVSDPSDPELLDEMTGTPLVRSNALLLVGDLVLSGGLSMLTLFDATGSQLAHVNRIGVPGTIRDFARSGSVVYACGGGSGVQILDVGNPLSPPVGQFYQGQVQAFDVRTDGEPQLIAISDGTLEVLGLSSPQTHELRGSVDLGLLGAAVSVVGDLAVAAGVTVHGPIVHTLDLADPSDPQVLGTAATAGAGLAEDVVIVDDVVVLALGAAGLETVDISIPSDPVPIGVHPTGGVAHRLAVWENHLFVANGPGGVPIFALSTPAAPELATTIPAGPDAIAISIIDGYAYIGGSASLTIVDVTVPASPVVVGVLPTPHFSDLVVQGDHCYLGGLDIQVVDVSNPWFPTTVGGVNSPTGVLGRVASLGSWIYANNPSGPGFSVFPIQCQQVVPILLDSFTARPAPDGIVISWQLGETKRSSDFRLERQLANRIEEIRIPASTASEFRVVDTEVEDGWRELRYVLHGRSDMSGWSILSETTIPAPSTQDRTRFLAARPNPFNGRTQLRLELEEPAGVEVAVYDAMGRRVRWLLREELAAGIHAIGWDGRDEGGREAGSGVYFVLATSNSFSLSQRVVFAK